MSLEAIVDDVKIENNLNYALKAYFNKDRNAYLIITCVQGSYSGLLNYNDTQYEIHTNLGSSYISKYDYHKMPVCEMGRPTNFEQSQILTKPYVTSPEKKQDFINLKKSKYTHNYVLNSQLDWKCKLRILVFYTPNSLISAGNEANLISRISTSVSLFGQSFINMGYSVPPEAELVAIKPTMLNETTSVVNDIDNFRNDGDGWWDDIHSYRRYYNADVCVLITDHYSSGISYNYMSSEPNAFCIVSEYVLVGAHQFQHQLGHIIGSQHAFGVGVTDLQMDLDYPKAHGYFNSNPGADFMTIMAGGCLPPGCDQLNRWSSSSSSHTYRGYATGDDVYFNNVLQIGFEYAHTMDFEEFQNQKIFSDSKKINVEQGDVIAQGIIHNNGNGLTIENGQIFTFRAEEINLFNHIEIQDGADFYAKSFSLLSNCGNPRLAPNYEDYGSAKQKPTFIKYNDIKETESKIKIYPNPSTNGKIFISNGETANFKLKIYTSSGVEAKNIIISKVLDGFKVSNLLPGFYLVKVWNYQMTSSIHKLEIL